MGFFNDYICKLAHGVACPGCRAIINTFQTKVVDPGLLAKWVEGEKMDTGCEITIRNGDFEAYGICEKCKELVFVVVPVEDGVLGRPTLLGFKSREELAKEGAEKEPPPQAPTPEPARSHLTAVAETYLLAIEGLAREHRERRSHLPPSIAALYMERIAALVHEYESLSANEKKED